MAYFTRNQVLLEPKRLMILPYMHERKIRINKMKNNCSYFYMMLEEQTYMMNYALKSKIAHIHKETVKMIVSMDMTRFKYSVFSE
jgi:hypothetical protein